MNYAEISKDTVSFLHKSYASLQNSPLNPPLRALVELRVSQINGCAYCCGLHSQEARKLGIEQEKLDALIGWSNSSLFTEEEVVALEWAEAITFMESGLAEKREALVEHFSDREIVDLTAAIAIMNALNRMAISLKE
ncbi:MAG: carboxymuconolactone decarboxylase family protein [Verrucomicrobia bacterium]|nr:carboxymuconolactone decarboxylase family protein [Verrucomicrobiota bacterium]